MMAAMTAPLTTRAASFEPQNLLEQTRQAHFAQTMDLVFERHPYYRERLAGLGLRRSDFQTLADLQRLPLTSKAEYMAAPEAFILDTQGLPQEMQTVWDTMYTTGSTSGRPTPFVSTSYDFFNILELQRRMLELRGVGPQDLIANLFPLTTTPHGAWIRVLHAAASMNVPVVCAMPGKPSPYFQLGNGLDEVVQLVGRSQATILWGVPSYIHRTLVRATELGLRWPAVRLVFVTGEALAESARTQMQQALEAVGAGSAQISISYGATEMQGGLVECQPGAGLHNPLPAQMLIEVVDPLTGLNLPDGQSGAVALTHLNRRGTVLLRYLLGDVSVRSQAPCPACGAVTERLVQTPRRSDALLKVKGMLIHPEAVLASLDALLGATPYLLSVQSTEPSQALSADRLVLRLEAQPDAARSRQLADEVKRACGVTPELQFEAVGSLAPTGGSWKAKKFVDLRSAH